MSIVISLCDLTGAMVRPWVEAGHSAILVDPQHIITREEGPVLKFAGTVRDALPLLGDVIRTRNVAAVFGFPPCTDLASSGARWWGDKRVKDYMFQAKAASVVFLRGCDGGSESEAATVPPRGSMADIRANGSESVRAEAIARDEYESEQGPGSWTLLEPIEQRGRIAAAIIAARRGAS